MRVVITILAVLAVLVTLLLVGIYSGAYSVAADQPESGLTHWALDTTQQQSVTAAAADIEAPSLTDTSKIEAGAHHFRGMCEMCHGAPGVERSEVGKGLNPEPPELSRAVREWTPAEMFWMVKHGIKMSGMPAFGETHSDEEIWSIIAFVRQLPEMTPEEYASDGEGAAATDGHGHGAGGHGEEDGDHAESAEAHDHG